MVPTGASVTHRSPADAFGLTRCACPVQWPAPPLRASPGGPTPRQFEFRFQIPNSQNRPRFGLPRKPQNTICAAQLLHAAQPVTIDRNQWSRSPEYAAATALGFDERLSLLVQAEVAWRDDRRLQRLLKAAKLKVSSACVEDIQWRASRALDRELVASLAGGDWIRNAQNLLITGATGCGKTWLACALAHQAARSGFSVLYVRAGRLFDELHVAHGDGSFARRLTQLAKLDVLVIDDFAISPMGAAERNDLLEVLDDRVGTKSTLITSQLPVKAWHTYLDDPTLADAILDRIVHSSHRINLKGGTLRDNKRASKAPCVSTVVTA